VDRAIDGTLANQLLEPEKFATREALRKGIQQVDAFTGSSGIVLPIFRQGMQLLLDYEMIIRNGVPFGERVGDVPPGFFAAIVLLGKGKGIIPLQVSDQRILKWTEDMGIDIGTVLSTVMTVDETQTEFPEL
jgi:hypothetical protein